MASEPFRAVDGYRIGDAVEWHATDDTWVHAQVLRVLRNERDLKVLVIRVTRDVAGVAYVGDLHEVTDGSDLRRP